MTIIVILWHDPNVLVLRFLRTKKSVVHTQCTKRDMEERMCKGRIFFASQKKINFRIEFKTKFGNECSLATIGDSDLLIPLLDANSFLVFFFKKEPVMDAQMIILAF